MIIKDIHLVGFNIVYKVSIPTPVLLLGKSHGRRSLVGCSPWGCKGSDTTERLHFHFSLSCIGEGNGNLLQCSSLENPRDGGAWWAAVYGVTQSQTYWSDLAAPQSSISFMPYCLALGCQALVPTIHIIWKEEDGSYPICYIFFREKDTSFLPRHFRKPYLNASGWKFIHFWTNAHGKESTPHQLT